MESEAANSQAQSPANGAGDEPLKAFVVKATGQFVAY